MNVSAIDISASGMRAQRLRMDLVANNLANVDTTSARRETHRTSDGTPYLRHVPYARKLAVFTTDPSGRTLGGVPVMVPRVVDDAAPFRAEHNPTHPHAVPAESGAKDAGMVYHPNVHPIAEMVDMIAASRAYEANVSAVDTAKSMSAAALRILA
jgi:flagellar basal-body rod protein FlgC